VFDGELVSHDLVIVKAERPSAMERRVRTAQPLVVFLNKGGATYRPGGDDPATNHSSVVQYFGLTQAVIPPFSGSSGEWEQYKQCVADTYAPFNIVVSDVEPTSGVYIEVSSGGDSSSIFGQSFGGIAPLGCSGVSAAVVFVMTDEYPGQPLAACWAAAQESSHALGLDHELLCADPMTYLYNCPLPKRFQDQNVQCGESAPGHTCTCTGQQQQNSYQWIASQVGLAGTCTPACAGKVCGSTDGCGGTCQAGSGCTSCTPSCAGKACGAADGCGGTCQAGSGCTTCTPVCTGKTCGSADGCGGTCQSGSGCNPSCTPACSGFVCGTSDGCGGTCQPGSGCKPQGGTDTLAPTVAIVSPDDGATLPGDASLTITVRATDNVGVVKASLVWEFTGETLDCPTSHAGITCTQSGDSFAWTLSPGSGSRSFHATALDAAGNLGQSPRRTVNLVTSGGLAVELQDPAPGAIFQGGDPIRVAAKISGATGPVHAVLNWSSPYGLRAFALVEATAGVYEIHGTLGMAGPRTWSVTATDSAGNSLTAAPRSATVR
jgi:hypothetical protein